MNARILGESQLLQYREGPGGRAHDRKTRRPIEAHGHTGGIFYYLFRTQGVGAKCFWCQTVNRMVRITMAADFVPTLNRSANKGGKSFSNPTKKEEGAFHPKLVEQVEEPVRALDYTRRKGFPCVTRCISSHTLGLEIIFDVDANRIDHYLTNAT